MICRTWFAAAACCSFLCGGLLLLLPTTGAAENTKPVALRIGVIQSMFRDTPEPLMQVAMRPFRAMLEKETGMTGEIIKGGDADNLGKQLQDGKFQLGVFQGVEFAWARLKNPKLLPLFICVNKETFLKAALVVRADSNVEVVSDLHGKDISLPRRSREHCHLFLQRRCAKPGQSPEKSFHTIKTPTDPDDALDDVVKGVVQAALIDVTLLDAYKAEKPANAGKLKILLQSEPFPCGIIACYPETLNAATLARIKTCLMNAGKTKEGKDFFAMCHITGFATLPDNYEQLFKDIAKAYPPSPPK